MRTGSRIECSDVKFRINGTLVDGAFDLSVRATDLHPAEVRAIRAGRDALDREWIERNRAALAYFVDHYRPPIALVVWLEGKIETPDFVLYGNRFQPVPDEDVPMLERLECGIERGNGPTYGQWPMSPMQRIRNHIADQLLKMVEGGFVLNTAGATAAIIESLSTDEMLTLAIAGPDPTEAYVRLDYSRYRSPQRALRRMMRPRNSR